MYHFGVVKALWEQQLLPRVISGSSVGSLVAGIVGTHTDDELPRIWKRGTLRLDAFENTQNGSLMRKLKRLLKTGR
jgi:predicted acylesterase/phospholipase RssA